MQLIQRVKHVDLGILPYKILCSYTKVHTVPSPEKCMLLVHRNANLATTTESIILQEYGNRFHNKIKPNKSNCNFLSENVALISHNSVVFPQNCKIYTKNCEITKNFIAIFSPHDFDFSELRVYISEFVFHNSDYFFFSELRETKSDF